MKESVRGEGNNNWVSDCAPNTDGLSEAKNHLYISMLVFGTY